jgi:hypothetical protein
VLVIKREEKRENKMQEGRRRSGIERQNERDPNPLVSHPTRTKEPRFSLM